ncbi:hypothetical protein [uncultured Endozoicomonas sp.]|uniref:hypothetical protein n=1 Tax=uncultured Endozoicomonas sp. TaxID=432652 RepID=UPI00261D8303|nr:hypothetical protein [uncultured Endozoicomonas sp.]
MFKKIRVFILLTILAMVGLNSWLTQVRSTDWNSPLTVAIHPINGDHSRKTEEYLNHVKSWHFKKVEQFISQEALRYGINIGTDISPITFQVGQPLHELPPALPADRTLFSTMLWSMKLRYWHRQMKSENSLAGADIHLYVIYHDPEQLPVLEHSVGLQKGMVGIVNAYGDRRYTSSNNVVIVHELLHTLGATDKYDLATGTPIFPEGYAAPEQTPRYPQKMAELMAGHIPISPSESKMPRSLSQTRIGPLTANEINWSE